MRDGQLKPVLPGKQAHSVWSATWCPQSSWPMWSSQLCLEMFRVLQSISKSSLAGRCINISRSKHWASQFGHLNSKGHLISVISVISVSPLLTWDPDSWPTRIEKSHTWFDSCDYIARTFFSAPQYHFASGGVQEARPASPVIFKVRSRWLSSDGLNGGGGHAIKYSCAGNQWGMTSIEVNACLVSKMANMGKRWYEWLVFDVACSHKSYGMLPCLPFLRFFSRLCIFEQNAKDWCVTPRRTGFCCDCAGCSGSPQHRARRRTLQILLQTWNKMKAQFAQCSILQILK